MVPAWYFAPQRPAKFKQPTVVGVDFPRVALSAARWEGEALHLAAHPQNAVVLGTRTKLTIINVGSASAWRMTRSNGEQVALPVADERVIVELVDDDQAVVIRPDG